VLFRSEFHRRIVSGDVTLTFRRWSGPRVRAGGTYRFGADGVLEVARVDEVPVRSITQASAEQAGYASRDELIEDLSRGSDLAPGDRVFRVKFRYVRRPDERAALARQSRLSASEADELAERLRRMDGASAHGPWTLATLEAIDARPRVAASRLAAALGRERLSFKQDVRKLKALGLTRSFEVGYEVSPRGRALLRHLRAGRRL
jgi:hypothetical protein